MSVWVGLFLFFVVAVVYVFTMPAFHTEIEDTYMHLRKVSTNSAMEQFAGNHLLHRFSVYGFYNLWRSLGYSGSAELPTQLLNLIAGLSILFVFHTLTAHLGFSRFLRMLSLCFLASCFSFWFATVECDTYPIATAFVMLAIHRLILIQRDFAKIQNHILLGVFAGCAVLFHIMNLLLAPLVFAFYMHNYLRGSCVISVYAKPFIWCSVAFCLAVMTPYFLVSGEVAHWKPVDMVHWIAGHANSGEWGYWAVSDPAKALVGLCRSVVGGHFILGSPTVKEGLSSLFPHVDLREEVYIAENLSGFWKVFLPVLALFCLGGGLFLVSQVLRVQPWRRAKPFSGNSFRFFLMCFVAAYTLFVVWWEPVNSRHWYPILPPLILFAGTIVAPVFVRPGTKGVAVFIVAGVFMMNLCGSIYPQTDPANDYWRAHYAWFREHCQEECTIVSGAGYVSDSFLRYETRARVISLGRRYGLSEGHLHEIVASSAGPVYISSTALDAESRPQQRKSGNDGVPVSLQPHLTKVHEDAFQTIYELAKNAMPRFWFDTPEARDAITASLNDEPYGHILTNEELTAWGCDFPDNRYGDLIYLMDPGHLLCPSYMGEKPLAGMHGYHPEDRDSVVAFMSNHIDADRLQHLMDIKAIIRKDLVHQMQARTR